jgi:hypothetical protein
MPRHSSFSFAVANFHGLKWDINRGSQYYLLLESRPQIIYNPDSTFLNSLLCCLAASLAEPSHKLMPNFRLPMKSFPLQPMLTGFHFTYPYLVFTTYS